MRKKNLNITRNKQEKTVVLRIQRHDKKLHESFAISKFDGSWTAAEDAARARRDILLPTLPARDSGKGRVTRRNTSGVVGVSLGTRSVIQKNGETHTYSRWIAKWPGCSKPGGMPWSLRTFGEDDAIFDFGTGTGIWAWYNNNPAAWAPIAGLSPEIVAVGDFDDSGQDDVLFDFGTGYGVWAWYNNDNTPQKKNKKLY